MFQSPGYLWLLLILPIFLWMGWPKRGINPVNGFAALTLRSLLVVFLILGLAELILLIPDERLSVIYLLDVSDSISKAQHQAAIDFIQKSIKDKPPKDQSGLLVFGGNALVETPISENMEVSAIESVPVTSQTDIGKAINFAQALFPSNTARRIVLLTDGKNNQGRLNEAVQVANTNGIDILHYPLASEIFADAAILNLQLPTRLAQHKNFDLSFTVYSSIRQPAAVRVLSSGEVIAEQDIQLEEGEHSFTFPLTASQIGVNEFEVQLIPTTDLIIQNNRLSGVTFVTGPPKVLVVSVPPGSLYPDGKVRPDEASSFIEVLESGNYEYELIQPENLPIEPVQLTPYNAVVMINVPGRDLSLPQMRCLQSYVRDLGGGLVTIGGLTSYGVGGYFDTPLEEMLPINMQNQDDVRQSTLTLVFVIDRSNSMTDTSGGISKLELAKEAVIRSIELLMPTDKVGVVVFDSSPRWASPITEVSNKDAILKAVGSIRSGGGTNILSGLQLVAQTLPGDDAQAKHVILLTDGGASPSGIPEIVQRMNQTYQITLTSVGVGNDAAPFLPDLALLGGGRYHHVTDPNTIPKIFTEETTLATRSYVVEQPFSPQIKVNSPILSGIGRLPVLHGYVSSSPKGAGTMILVSDRGDPILASWQFGLGKTIAFTSDASGRWARNWLTWSGFPTIWSQIISYVSSPVDSSNIEMIVESIEGTSVVTVTARDDRGETMNSFEMNAKIVGQDGNVLEVSLEQTGAGRYQASIDALEPGTYTISLFGSDSESDNNIIETFGWSQTYSPEYLPTTNQASQLLTTLPKIEEPGQAFRHNLGRHYSIKPIWQRLLALAEILLVLDIAVRRIKISKRELAAGRERLEYTFSLGRKSSLPMTSTQITALAGIKQRARKRNQSIRSSSIQPVIIPSSNVVREAKTMVTADGTESASYSTAATLLSKKRERKKGSQSATPNTTR